MSLGAIAARDVAAVVLVVALVLIVLVVRLLIRAGEKSTFYDAEPAPPPSPPREPAAGGEPPAAAGTASRHALRRAFRQAMRRLDHHAARPEPRYRLPWILLTGEEGSRDEELLGRARFALPFGAPEPTGLPAVARCDWWFLERGLVLDLGGRHVLASDAANTDEAAFRTVLALLQRHRPGRPLDGVVLTVSAAELQRSARAGEQGAARLEERGALIYRRLWQAQKRLGVRFPVYVLVTGCQAVTGFDAFAAALPREHLGEMLGWSSPYSPDTAWRSEWVGEAFTTLGARLERIQNEVFSDRAQAVDTDRLFVFPEAFAALAGPLERYLHPIFRPSAYHESVLLRGIYFAGDLPASGPDAVALPGEPPAAFVRDLFDRKAFAEVGLARPTRATLVARNRRVRAVQAAVVAGALVLGLGTWWADVRLGRSKRTLEPALGEISEHVHQVGLQRLHHPDRPPELAQERRWAEHLFASMGAIDIDRFGSVFLPSSWFSPFNGRLESALVRAFQQVVFTALRSELDHRAELLAPPLPLGAQQPMCLGSSPAPGRRAVLDAASARTPAAAVGEDDDAGLGTSRSEPVSIAPAAAPARTEEFQALRSWVSEVRQLEAAGATYDRLGDSHDLSDLARVAEYAFEIQLPQAFYDHSGLYREAQRRARRPGLDLGSFRPGAVRRAEDLSEAFDRRLFGASELVTTLDEVSQGLDDLAGQRWRSDQGASSVDILLARIRHLEDLLSEPELAWVFRPQFDLGPDYRTLLVDVARSDLLGRGVADCLRRQTEAGWIELRRRITGARSQLTDTLLEVDLDQPRPRLSPDLLLFETTLAQALGQGLERQAGVVDRIVPEIPAGTRVVWDVERLRQAAALEDSYQRFLETTLPRFPVEVQPAIEGVARQRLGANVISEVVRSESLEALPEAASPVVLERRLRDDVAGFQAAAEPLSRLIGLLHRIGLWRERQDLADLVNEQGGRLLAQVDRLLQARGPYTPRQGGFGWWDGSAPVALPAFDVSSPNDLEAYLQAQRSQVATLAQQYAAPLVTWLGQTGVESDPVYRPLYRKWEGILTALADNDGKKPGNSVGELETFIGKDLASFGLDDCFPVLSAGSVSGAGEDFFSASRRQLGKELRSRCWTLTAERARAHYGALADLFNRRLAGRFPFADDPEAGFEAEAAPEDVAAFFQLFDRSSGLFQAAASAEGPSGAPALPRDVLDFLDEIRRVRSFFAPFLDAKTPQKAPLYDVEADFRVNRDHEVGGYQIIDWVLEVGNQRFTNRDEARRLRWGPGEPVALTLRWASDAPRQPVSPARPAVRTWSSVDGRTVSYRFTNRWSLLSALEVLRARPEDVAAFTDLEPQTLGLSITTRRVADGLPDAQPTEVFVRLSVLAPDSSETLSVPRFPSRAPLADAAKGRLS